MSYTDNLADELFFDLQVELSNDEEGGSFSEPLLKQKIKSAIREVRDKRRYPLGYTDGMIAQDLDRYYITIITRLALRVRVSIVRIPFSEQW